MHSLPSSARWLLLVTWMQASNVIRFPLLPFYQITIPFWYSAIARMRGRPSANQRSTTSPPSNTPRKRLSLLQRRSQFTPSNTELTLGPFPVLRGHWILFWLRPVDELNQLCLTCGCGIEGRDGRTGPVAAADGGHARVFEAGAEDG